MDHSDRSCSKRTYEVNQNSLKVHQFGSWLIAKSGKLVAGGIMRSKLNNDMGQNILLKKIEQEADARRGK